MKYEDVAQAAEVDWCPAPSGSTRLGGVCRAPEANHVRGFADIGRSCVHWQDRRWTKSGVRRFLMLAAAVRLRHNRGQPRWLQVYEQSTWASEVAILKLRKVIPRRLSNGDRAQVMWLLRKDQGTDRPKARERARVWAYGRR